jgi:translocation and assembly module TamB
LRIEAAGNQQQLTANASFDLNALSEQLGQFVDLSGVQLAGTGSAQVAWEQPADGKFAAKASTDLSQLKVALGDGTAWSEPQLTLRAEAAGSMDPKSHQPTRVDTAQLQINGQGDQLEARLVSAVDMTNTTAIFPITVRSTGSIARWLTRVRPWFAPGQWNIDGASDFTADLRLAGNAFEATNTKLVVTNLRATNPDWNINESRVEFAGDARWNGATGELAANSAQLVSSTVAVAAKGVHYSQPGASNLSGAAAFRTDLARLATWRRSATQPAQYQPSGEFTGNIRFAQQAGHITGEINATGQNVVLASLAQPAKGSAAAAGYQTIWQEPKVTIQGATSYDTAADRLSFDQFQIQSNTVQANAAGQIQKLSTVAECDLKGTLNYDLAQVTPLLRPYVGTGVQLTGREQARFILAGQLSSPGTLQAQTVAYSPQSEIRNPKSEIHWSRRVRAQLELPWSGANLYGLPIGAGRLAATLGDGSLHLEPINLAVGEGQLTAAPNVRFDPEPAELSMPAGPVLTNVRISSEVSEAMLKFVAPVLAGATQSEGLFSLQLDGARIPLSEPRSADSKGQLTVHSVRVVPGPMAAQWVGLAQQVEALAKRRDPASLSNRQVTLVSIRDQQVNFQVANGRVYHQKMEFQVGDVVLRSQGSVGLDETVALTIEIPVQDAWVAKEPLLAGLKGQSVQIPVSGTLTKPQMDQHAIASLTGQLLQKGAGQAVGNELNKALDKFLKPRQ